MIEKVFPARATSSARMVITRYFMASITIRNLDDTVKRRLRLRAAQRNRSMEDEARDILRMALAQQPAQVGNLADAIRTVGGHRAVTAAIARSRGAALATRNVGDFADCQLELIDPWV
jgi:antitoxin FitA